MTRDALTAGADGKPRCPWAVGGAPEYVPYHDEEWGRPVLDDDRLFERLCLEAFQSGLSWLTILRKRQSFRAAFAGFHIPAVAAFGAGDVERLLADPGIVRNRKKIEAAVANAQAAAELVSAEGSLAAFCWAYRPAMRVTPLLMADMAATTPESTALAGELKRRGFRFVGPTTAYALMQAAGIVNDHVAGCWVRDEVEREQITAAARFAGRPHC
jgi:DNA-3-methyladenine glycosylase I